MASRPDPFGRSIGALPLPADTSAPRVARQHIEAHSAQLDPDLVHDALLLVSELVSNAVQHGEPDFALHLRVSATRLVVGVQDGGEGTSFVPKLPSSSAESGRGLAIVATLATQWGVVPIDPPPGKTVWFQLG